MPTNESLQRCRICGANLPQTATHHHRLRISEWQPQKPPVQITTQFAVTDVLPYIHQTLARLESVLRGEDQLAGAGAVRALIARLRSLGVKVMVSSENGTQCSSPERLLLCANCSRPLPAERTKFCSDTCSDEAKRKAGREQYGHRHHFVCTECGGESGRR